MVEQLTTQVLELAFIRYPVLHDEHFTLFA